MKKNIFVGWELLELLGIDAKLAREATIHIEVSKQLTVSVTYLVKRNGSFVVNDKGDAIKTVVKKHTPKGIKK